MRNSAIRLSLSKLTTTTTSDSGRIQSSDWSPCYLWNIHSNGAMIWDSTSIRDSFEEYIGNVLDGLPVAAGVFRAEFWRVTLTVETKESRLFIYPDAFLLSEIQLRVMCRAFDNLSRRAAYRHAFQLFDSSVEVDA